MVAELKAIKILTKQGYWCARSLDPQSPFDIVAVDKKGKILIPVFAVGRSQEVMLVLEKLPSKINNTRSNFLNQLFCF